MGTVDGAWWPRSTDPLAEFPAMIAGIELHRGPVNRVAFNSIVWDSAPDRVVIPPEAKTGGHRSHRAGGE